MKRCPGLEEKKGVFEAKQMCYGDGRIILYCDKLSKMVISSMWLKFGVCGIAVRKLYFGHI